MPLAVYTLVSWLIIQLCVLQCGYPGSVPGWVIALFVFSLRSQAGTRLLIVTTANGSPVSTESDGEISTYHSQSFPQLGFI